MAGTGKHREWWKVIGLGLVTGLMIVLVFLHLDGINGPFYWRWPWRNLPVGRVGGMMAAGSIPVFSAVYFFGRRWMPVWGAMVLLMGGSLAMRLAGAVVLSDPISLDFVRRATVDPLIGSYWTSAAALANYPDVLRIYYEALPHLAFHAVNKPPGPTLYHLAFIRAMGYGDLAALWSGLGLGILATFSIPSLYAFVRCLTGSPRGAFTASAWLAMSPGFLLFFPMTDPVYPIFTCWLSILWFKALHHNRWYWSALFGAVLFAATFSTYGVLVLGAFFTGMILIVPQAEDFWKRIGCGLKHAMIAVAVCVAAYVVLWSFTSFDPILTFFTAYKAQADLISTSPRSHIFPQTIPWDLYDFVLGAGWVVLLIVIYWLARGDFKGVTGKLVLLALAQILVTAGTGLLQAETARVWNFLYPLLLLPVGLELSSWGRGKVICVLICLLLITAAIHMNMVFINEG